LFDAELVAAFRPLRLHRIYFIVTGRDDDAKAAQAAEAKLKDAIDRSIGATKNQARLESVK
jgi:hypothetical protein